MWTAGRKKDNRAANTSMSFLAGFTQKDTHNHKGGEIRHTKTLNLSRKIVGFQVFGRCFSFFTLRDQLVAQQKKNISCGLKDLLRILEELEFVADFGGRI